MNPRIRRQLWLLLIFVALAYWWWGSIGTDRYGVIPLDSKLHDSLPLPSLSDQEWQSDSMLYEDSEHRNRVFIRTRILGDTMIARIETVTDGEPERVIDAILRDAYYPISITQSQAGESAHVVSIAEQEIVMRRVQGDGKVTTFPDRRGALFDDLLLLQIHAWKAIEDSVNTELVSFASDEYPIRVHAITLRPDGDSAIFIHFGARQSARVVFERGSGRVKTLHTAQGITYVLKTPKEEP